MFPKQNNIVNFDFLPITKDINARELWKIWHGYIVWIVLAVSVIIVWNKVPDEGISDTVGKLDYMKDLTEGTFDSYFNQQSLVSSG